MSLNQRQLLDSIAVLSKNSTLSWSVVSLPAESYFGEQVNIYGSSVIHVQKKPFRFEVIEKNYRTEYPSITLRVREPLGDNVENVLLEIFSGERGGSPLAESWYDLTKTLIEAAKLIPYDGLEANLTSGLEPGETFTNALAKYAELSIAQEVQGF